VFDRKARVDLCREISATNDSLYTLTREWHMQLDKAARVRNFSILRENRIKLGQFISRRRSAVANLELPADAETLRQSEDVFLSNQSAVIADVYPRFEAYNDLTPDSTIQRMLMTVKGDEDNVLAWKLTIKKSMEAFIKKHGLKIPK
jgi:hypothetical protein